MQTTTNKLRTFSLLFAAAIVLGLSSCQKDPDVTPGPTPAASKIKEYKNGDEFIRFTYNTDGSIKKATVNSELNTGGDVVDFNVTYNAQKKIEEVTTTAGERIVPRYENNVMVRADVFDGPVRVSYINYHYEGDQLKNATIYFNQGAGFEPFLEFRFNYNANGNLSETIAMMANGVPGVLVRAGHVSFQYDQKTNPLYEHRDFLALLWQGASKNNITREEHFDATLNPEDLITYVYTYKANGLPEKATATRGLPGQPPVISTLDFLYQ